MRRRGTCSISSDASAWLRAKPCLAAGSSARSPCRGSSSHWIPKHPERDRRFRVKPLRAPTTFGRLALRMGIVNEDDLVRAEAERKPGESIERALTRMGALTHELAEYVYAALPIVRQAG